MAELRKLRRGRPLLDSPTAILETARQLRLKKRDKSTKRFNRKRENIEPFGLKPNEALYAAESLKPGISKVQAAKNAGLDYVPKGVAIVRARKELIERQLTAADATVENIVRELLRVALFDPRRMFDVEGNLIPIPELDADTAAAVAGMDVEKRTDGRGEDRETYYVMKIKIAPKVAALETLAKLHYDSTGKMKLPGKDGGALAPSSLDNIDQALVKLVQAVEQRLTA
jgi:phage terminase small subunit